MAEIFTLPGLIDTEEVTVEVQYRKPDTLEPEIAVIIVRDATGYALGSANYDIPAWSPEGTAEAILVHVMSAYPTDMRDFDHARVVVHYYDLLDRVAKGEEYTRYRDYDPFDAIVDMPYDNIEDEYYRIMESIRTL